MSDIARACAQNREEFKELGVVVLRGLFTREMRRTVAAGIEYNKKKPSQFSSRTQDEEGPGKHFADYCNWKKIKEFEHFVRQSPAGEIAGRMMGSKVIIKSMESNSSKI